MGKWYRYKEGEGVRGMEGEESRGKEMGTTRNAYEFLGMRVSSCTCMFLVAPLELFGPSNSYSHLVFRGCK